MINSSKDIQAGEGLNIERFRLNSLTAGEPSYFEAIFCDEDNQYRYGVEADNSLVHSIRMKQIIVEFSRYADWGIENFENIYFEYSRPEKMTG